MNTTLEHRAVEPVHSRSYKVMQFLQRTPVHATIIFIALIWTIPTFAPPRTALKAMIFPLIGA